MTPAEKRVKELVDRWIASLELHMQYVELKDSAYNNVQPWPVHDRPTRWVLEHAQQKTNELKALVENRVAMGDAKFAEAFELIVFLANLVGLQHVQRFIPLADPGRHGIATLTEMDGIQPVAKAPAPTPSPAQAAPTPKAAAPSPASAPKATPAPPPPRPVVSDTVESTRQMPPPTPPRPKPAPARKAEASAKSAPDTANLQAESEVHNLVINDAVRLLNWGRRWHELAELIARIADRPKLPDVRRILRSHRAAIEMRAAAEPEKEEEKDE